MAIRRILIANRGEIAVRIIRTCEALGIETVLCVSEADRNSLGAQMATRAVCIGPASPARSYLSMETVMQAAIGYHCDAIHPGYGFLSERAEMAKMCEDEAVIFIGPTASQIEAVGDKLRARSEAIAADVPVVPGGPVETPEDARKLAEEIGAPLLIKAVGGGGGRGMKLVENLKDLNSTMDMASAEAGAAFGDARVYIERYVEHGRHIEVQLLGDGAGRVIHLGERDCSVQRRYQKLVEETPAPHLPPATREKLLDAAVRFAERLHYRGAGTVEFLYDVARDEFYFLEMNARIQVEHPVTEMVSGVDLIAQQIAIAADEGLRVTQEEIGLNGAAIECRINAEDPANGFMPSPGTVTSVQWPEGEGIRVDTHIVEGASIPPFYDSMIAKIIAHGPDRATALARLRGALERTRIDGIATNLAFQQEVLAEPEFAAGGVDTGFLARKLQKEPA
ncbi:acetyl-CoA carboxylase biotin carboxylase subunit [Altererythrobacter atlanticus]|uniref:Biotin carboxylase n=1 Tax=Croceibacterium atlanticum TaxID=1267766 RepID=A0A0F7KX21_9SPHN|nr:acetyl-CoA carboxylase biotin carboxylase subunit [Croceibacterium atlanticum]AKH44224.1 Biotin carboxylase [Croceibacterium atlanticum]MBB5732535.1 acetyl-CoA carboxylase biotin carboxylase subunit [Croceibacterium atlanticum]